MRVLMLVLLLGLGAQSAATSAEPVDRQGVAVETQVVPAETASPIPYKREDPPLVQQFSQIGLALLIALALAVLVIFILKRFTTNGQHIAGGARIRRLEARRLSAKLTLHLVEVDRVEYLIVQSGEQVQIQTHLASVKTNPES